MQIQSPAAASGTAAATAPTCVCGEPSFLCEGGSCPLGVTTGARSLRRVMCAKLRMRSACRDAGEARSRYQKALQGAGLAVCLSCRAPESLLGDASSGGRKGTRPPLAAAASAISSRSFECISRKTQSLPPNASSLSRAFLSFLLCFNYLCNTDLPPPHIFPAPQWPSRRGFPARRLSTTSLTGLLPTSLSRPALVSASALLRLPFCSSGGCGPLLSSPVLVLAPLMPTPRGSLTPLALLAVPLSAPALPQRPSTPPERSFSCSAARYWKLRPSFSCSCSLCFCCLTTYIHTSLHHHLQVCLANRACRGAPIDYLCTGDRSGHAWM